MIGTDGIRWIAVSISLLGLVAGTVSAAERDAAHQVDGVVTDRGGTPVEGVAVAVDDRGRVTVTDAEGRFSLALKGGRHTLRFSHPAYHTQRRELVVDGDVSGLSIRLAPPLSATDSITVTAIRASDQAPVTTRNMSDEEIDRLSHGQDPPSLVQYTPSVTWYSDSGGGSNYSYFSLRGIQQSRINITFDGAPLNDPAEHALYFNNFHDFTSAVDSIQIQRGVGTSTVGSPSYGGSVNFASLPFTLAPQGEFRLGVGSWGTRRASAAFQSGVLDNGFAFSGRVSYSTTDGYRDHSGSEHDTVFFNAGWQGERSQLKLVSFFGSEKSQMAFLAVDPETLSQNPRFNPMAEEERDGFGQDFMQLQYTLAMGPDTMLMASLYLNRADGVFTLWDDPVTKTTLLDFGIDQVFYGSMVTLSHRGDRLDLTLGVHGNDFSGDHTLDINDERVYLNTGLKTQANGFVKLGYDLDRWYLFADLQLRWTRFDYQGDIDLGSVDWTFVDPKLGFRCRLAPTLSLYASVGAAEREPARLDMLAGEDNATVAHDLEAVRPERVVDLEAGVDYSSPRLTLQANLYAMDFRDEIALTGELSDIGLPLRRNVDRSYRRGVELDLRWVLDRHWTVTHSSSLSRNRIREWTQYYDVYDADGNWIGSEPRLHRDVPPLLTPEVIVSQGVEFAQGSWELAATARWVDDAFLDNTGSRDLRTPSHLSIDLRGSLRLDSWTWLGSPRVTVWIDNLLDDEEIYPSGYSYQYLSRDPGAGDILGGIPYYYPRAARNFTVALDFGF